jgi:calcineurin-like phosphoesterase family protein
MKTYFTSDTHYGHTNTWKKFKKPGSETEPLRPFLSDDVMDQTMIENWNKVVTPNDIVYHLGDFAMGKVSAPGILSRLNGKKVLIWGNHDSDQVRQLPQWEFSTPYHELRLDGKFIVLCHYKFDTFNKSHHGSLQFYGHSHGSNSDNDQQVDVGVDCWNYTPVSLQQILERMKRLPSFRSKDHHQRKANS